VDLSSATAPVYIIGNALPNVGLERPDPHAITADANANRITLGGAADAAELPGGSGLARVGPNGELGGGQRSTVSSHQRAPACVLDPANAMLGAAPSSSFR
jgi:hypothetical protein